MRKYFVILFLMLWEVTSIWFIQAATLADAPLAQELSISQIKITGDEVLVLRNNTSSNLQLGSFWLQYYNDFNLSNFGLSNSSAQLPSVTLQPNQEILLTAGTAANCGQVWVSKLPFSFKDSAGLLQIVGLSQASGVVGYRPEDQVSWSSKTIDATDIKGVSSSSPAQLWYKNGSGWQATTSPPGCLVVGTTVSQSTNTASTLNQTSTSPPSVVLSSTTNSSDSASGLPPADAGLSSPQISEILPNPAPPQTDAADEFIELYNPNDAPFDLSGFSLQVGTSTVHNFVFPAGQFILQPHEFRAFYATQTSLSLSNEGGQAMLLDPLGDVLAKTDVYSTAKDGQSWALANGMWQWTASPTPNEANKIVASATVKKANSKSSSAKTSSAKAKSSKSSPSSSAISNTNPPASTTSLHPAILAVVGAAALVYALYEYRHDLANAYYRFRRNRGAGASAGQITPTAGSN